MHGFMYGIINIFWVLCYGAAIWICVIGKQRNPNKGWNFIIAAEVICIIDYIPFLYYYFFTSKIHSVLLLKSSPYFFYVSYVLVIPLGMILSLVGLYFLAQGKKKKSKKKAKKRSGTS